MKLGRARRKTRSEQIGFVPSSRISSPAPHTGLSSNLTATSPGRQTAHKKESEGAHVSSVIGTEQAAMDRIEVRAGG